MTEPQIRYTTTADGVSIAYYAMGEDETLLIASNVLWSDVRRSNRFFPEHSRSGEGIGRGMRVVRYDSRGAGMSDRSALDFSLDARIRDIDAVVARLELETFVLFAMTHGCLAAVEYAARNPEKVSRLVLSNPITNGQDTRHRTRRWDSLREMASEEWEEYTLTMAAANVGYDRPELIPAMAQRMREAMSPAAVQATFEALGEIDVTASLPMLKMPTLVMFRQLVSRVITAEDARAVASMIHDAEFVETAREPAPFWSQGDTAAVERFLGIAPDPKGARIAADPLSASSLPSTGTLKTILFTDIVGHTEMMQRLGDARGREVLREHERITRDLLKQHGGAEIKTMGDGFMASFASVTSSMDCAIALQRAFAEQNLEPRTENLSVRVGLNAGEPIEENGDLFGSTVIMASRIAAKAGAGEVLIPGPLRHLLSGKSYVYADRGETMLKGFENAVRLYEVRWREDEP